MAYDANASDGYLVLFGGEGPNGPLGDTWTFQDGSWTNVTPPLLNATNSPSPRFGATMAYDALDGYLLLFGGEAGPFTGSNNPLFNDTWEFQHGNWTQLCTACVPGVSAPTPRLESEASYDPSAHEVVLFGGLTVSAGAYTPLNDTWAFAGGAWSQLAPATVPEARYSAGLALNASSSNPVLFGGCARPLQSLQLVCASPLNDTWTYASANWVSEGTAGSSAPDPRSGFGFASSPAGEGPLLYGGTDAVGYLNQTWQLGNGGWDDLTDALLQSPTPREDAALGFDAAAGAGYYVLFGGSNGTYVGETWVYPSPFSPLRVDGPTASPTVLDAGQRLDLSVAVAGGAGEYNLSWSGLPFGCLSSNSTSITCRPGTSGGAPTTSYVSVRVRDAVGSIVWSASTAVLVNPTPFVSVDTASRTVGLVPLNVTVFAVTYEGTAPFAYSWVFGDGTPSVTGNPVTHQFDAIGKFSVTVWSNDSRGDSSNSSLSVRTASPLVVEVFVIPGTSFDAGTNATIEAQASGGFPPYVYHWSGLPSSCPAIAGSVRCSFGEGGTYQVSVQVTDLYDFNASQTTTISVTPTFQLSLPLWLWPTLAIAAGVLVVAWVWWATRPRPPRPRLAPEEPRDSSAQPPVPPTT